MIEWRHDINPVDYKIAEETMERRVTDIISNKKPELIWFLEHTDIYTLGTSTKKRDFISESTVPFYNTKRGGQTTYHGPGQRIIYLMLDLRKRERDVKRLIWNIEEWIILVLKDLGLTGYRLQGLVGVWVDDQIRSNRDGTSDKKIAAMGLRLKKWVTYHGLSFNVNPDLSFFKKINPCGIIDKDVTSLQEIGKEASMQDVDFLFKENFSKVFG